MDPNEIEYAECAPEHDDAHDAHMAHLDDQEALKLDWCACEPEKECFDCRASRLATQAPIVWEPNQRRVILQEDGQPLMYVDEVAVEAEIDEYLARKMPQPAPVYRPRHAFGKRIA